MEAPFCVGVRPGMRNWGWGAAKLQRRRFLISVGRRRGRRNEAPSAPRPPYARLRLRYDELRPAAASLRAAYSKVGAPYFHLTTPASVLGTLESATRECRTAPSHLRPAISRSQPPHSALHIETSPRRTTTSACRSAISPRRATNCELRASGPGSDARLLSPEPGSLRVPGISVVVRHNELNASPRDRRGRKKMAVAPSGRLGSAVNEVSARSSKHSGTTPFTCIGRDSCVAAKRLLTPRKLS
jgi:hypothetical protein